ncbi:DUF3784 domain-containing protein [Lysinibacillus agricola]|uniref:DUF3784 domain-containing protein n=1 Tax=Lysinibacillus agricola TaxID=2590012 RepID=UPI003C1CE8DB
MGIEMVIGLVIGVFLIGAGYIVRTKQAFAFLAGFRETWEPVNKERLGNRIGILLIIIGVIAIFTSIFTIWFGATVGKTSGVLAIIDVIMIIIVIGLDQIGY